MSSLYNPTIEAIEAWLLGYTEVSLKSTFFKSTVRLSGLYNSFDDAESPSCWN